MNGGLGENSIRMAPEKEPKNQWMAGAARQISASHASALRQPPHRGACLFLPLGRRERLIEVGDNVVYMLDTDRQAHIARRDPRGRLLFRRQL